MTNEPDAQPWEFESFRITKIEDLVTLDRFGFVEAYISFTDPRCNAHPDLKIRVPIQYERSWTLDKVRDVAFAEIRRTLAEASNLLANHSLGQLQKRVDDAEY